jgi:hypothetical protein
MGNLPKEVTKYLRRTFTEAERLQMADELAACHSRQATIDNEEAVIKQQFKVRRTQIEGTIETLVLNLQQKFTMENIKCRIEYGKPNPLEVSFIRIDTGEVVETRAMTADERQQELPLEVPPNEAAAEASAEQSAANVAEFFGAQDRTAADQPEPIEIEQVEVATNMVFDRAPDARQIPIERDDNPYLTAEAIQHAEDPAPSFFIQQEQDALAAMPDEGIDRPSPGPELITADEMFAQAVRLTVEGGKCSTSILQRELAIGYARAAQLINLMENAGVVGPGEGNGKREVLKDKAWLAEVMSGTVDRHPADEVIAPKEASPVANIADEHKKRVANTFKPKALRESGFKAEEPKLPEQW